MFFELIFDVGERELGTVDGNVDFGQNPRQATDVVLVPMGEDDGANFIAILDQIADVRNHDVHAQQFGFGEHQSGINDKNVVAPANRHAVHTELAQSA